MLQARTQLITASCSTILSVLAIWMGCDLDSNLCELTCSGLQLANSLILGNVIIIVSHHSILHLASYLHTTHGIVSKAGLSEQMSLLGGLLTGKVDMHVASVHAQAECFKARRNSI